MASTLAQYYSGKGQALPSVSERAKIAAGYGITGYTGTVDQNNKLLGILQGGSSPTVATAAPGAFGPSKPGFVQGTADTKLDSSFIGPVKSVVETAAIPTSIKTPAPTKDAFQTQLDSFGQSIYSARTDASSPFQSDQQIADTVKSFLPNNAPALPNFTQQYTDLLASKGVPGIEQGLTDLNTQKQAIIDQSKARTAAETAKQVPLSLMAGRISEEQKQDNERIAVIDNQINTASSQLTSAYKVIDTIMGLTEKDYTAASDQYKTQFDNAIKSFNLFETIKKDQNDEITKVQDVARANVQVYANLIKDGNFNVSSLPLTTQVEIAKMEVQSGLGVGFLSSVKKSAKASTDTVISHNTRTLADGTQVVDVIYQGKDGQPYVKTLNTGYDKPTGNAANSQLVATITTGLDKLKNSYGDVSPSDWAAARSAYLKSGGTNAEFIQNFASYADTNRGDFLESYGFPNPAKPAIDPATGKPYTK